jgi:hypothetical protein
MSTQTDLSADDTQMSRTETRRWGPDYSKLLEVSLSQIEKSRGFHSRRFHIASDFAAEIFLAATNA